MPGHVWRPNPKCKNYFLKYKGADNRWYVESSGTDNKTDARKLLRAKLTAVDRGEQVTPALGKFSFDDAAKDLLNDYTNNNTTHCYNSISIFICSSIISSSIITTPSRPTVAGGEGTPMATA